MGKQKEPGAEGVEGDLERDAVKPSAFGDQCTGFAFPTEVRSSSVDGAGGLRHLSGYPPEICYSPVEHGTRLFSGLPVDSDSSLHLRLQLAGIEVQHSTCPFGCDNSSFSVERNGLSRPRGTGSLEKVVVNSGLRSGAHPALLWYRIFGC